MKFFSSEDFHQSNHESFFVIKPLLQQRSRNYQANVQIDGIVSDFILVVGVALSSTRIFIELGFEATASALHLVFFFWKNDTKHSQDFHSDCSTELSIDQGLLIIHMWFSGPKLWWHFDGDIVQMGFTLIEWGRIFKPHSIARIRKVSEWKFINGALTITVTAFCGCIVSLIYCKYSSAIWNKWIHISITNILCLPFVISVRYWRSFHCEMRIRKREKEQRQMWVCKVNKTTKIHLKCFFVKSKRHVSSFSVFRCVIDTGCENSIRHWMSLICI